MVFMPVCGFQGLAGKRLPEGTAAQRCLLAKAPSYQPEDWPLWAATRDISA